MDKFPPLFPTFFPCIVSSVSEKLIILKMRRTLLLTLFEIRIRRRFKRSVLVLKTPTKAKRRAVRNSVVRKITSKVPPPDVSARRTTTERGPL